MIDHELPHPNREYVAIDFETANEKRASACSVGVAVVHDRAIVQQKAWLIRPPEMRFHPLNIGIHGIKPEDVEDAPLFSELWPVLQQYLEGNTVIAHNAGFDMGVLGGMLDRYRLPRPRLFYSCTVAMARDVWPGLRNYKLNTVATHLGIDFQHHDAAEDAMAAAKIAIHACAEANCSTLKDLLKAVRIRRRGFC